jgi:hypothetical protein
MNIIKGGHMSMKQKVIMLMITGLLFAMAGCVIVEKDSQDISIMNDGQRYLVGKFKITPKLGAVTFVAIKKYEADSAISKFFVKQFPTGDFRSIDQINLEIKGEVEFEIYADVATTDKKTLSFSMSDFIFKNKFGVNETSSVKLEYQISITELINLFNETISIPIGSWPEAVAIGDMNKDDRNDVVLVTSNYVDNENDHKVFIFHQDANGELMNPVKFDTLGSRTETVCLGDFNSDDKMDMAVGNFDENLVIFYQANPTLFIPVVVNTQNAYKVCKGDFNNDGRDDIAAIGWSSNTLKIYLQNSLGLLNLPVSYDVEYGGWDDMKIGDLNGDNRDDVAVMSGQGTCQVGVLYQDINGKLRDPGYFNLGNDTWLNQLHGVAIGDVDGNGLNDLIVTSGGNRPHSYVSIFYQMSDENFGAPVSLSSHDCVEPVQVADINSDKKSDIVVLHGGWCTLGTYIQNTNGNLLSETLYEIPYASHYNPQGFAIGDINGDGHQDVVIADYNSGLDILYHK